MIPVGQEHPGAAEIVSALSPEFRAQQIEKLHADPDDVTFYLAIELPPIGICRDYARYLDDFVATAWARANFSMQDYATPIT
eukprot:11222765-Alexandrium_andersonii.AAC.1